jgi:hypothetical protein
VNIDVALRQIRNVHVHSDHVTAANDDVCHPNSPCDGNDHYHRQPW